MEKTENQATFQREYPDLFDYTYRYMRYRIPNATDAEDAAAEVFVDAYGHLDVFDATRGNLKQWVTGIARHRVQQYWKSRREHLSLDELPADPPSPPGVSVDDRIYAERILRNLPPGTKALLALRYEDGLTHEEIAELTGKEPAAVRQFFSRLHRNLRLEYAEANP